MNDLIIATTNRHKFQEIAPLIQGHTGTLPICPQNLPAVEEDCLSFVGNALKKAKLISQTTGQAVLADDSGLVVPALDGRPGVFSARFAGVGATDDQNNQKLLTELKYIPSSSRNAFYVCAIVVYRPDGVFYTSVGELHGTIIDEYRGKNGFGYDPLFFMPEKNCTLAEIPREEKIKFSHRSKALEQLLKITDLRF